MRASKLAAVRGGGLGFSSLILLCWWCPVMNQLILWRGGRLPTLEGARPKGKGPRGFGYRAPRVVRRRHESQGCGAARNGEGFVEAHLWVCTRGRPYKPRFAAERAVVLVSGGGAGDGGADTPVAAAGNGIAARRAASSAGAASASSSTHPLAALIDAVPRADALFRDTRCEALFVVDYSPLARDLPSELASTFPGKVAKPVGRVMQKLNPRNAVFAASGADAAVLFKAMKLTGDDGAACVVVAKPGDIPRVGIPREPSRRRRRSSRASTPKRRWRRRCPTANTSIRCRRAVTHRAVTHRAVTRRSTPPSRSGTNRRLRWTGTTMSLDVDDAPVFYARVTFEHDRQSKQIEQKVTALRAEDVRALAKEAKGDKDEEEKEEEEEEEEEQKEEEKEPARSRSIPAGPADVSLDVSSGRDTADDAAAADADDRPGPIIYSARRPFHPARLAAVAPRPPRHRRRVDGRGRPAGRGDAGCDRRGV